MARLTVPTAPSLTLLLNIIFISCMPESSIPPGDMTSGGASGAVNGGAGGSGRGGAGGSKKGGSGGAKPVGGKGGSSDPVGGNGGGSGEDAAVSVDTKSGDDASNAPEAPVAPAAPKLSTDVAPIAKKRCALSGCHDPIKHEHNMDVSTAEKAYNSWVNKTTVDHCKGNAVVTRVVPGKPEMSFIVTLVEATTGRCNDLKRMPPPPLAPLPAEEAKVIREWVAAGAKND